MGLPAHWDTSVVLSSLHPLCHPRFPLPTLLSTTFLNKYPLCILQWDTPSILICTDTLKPEVFCCSLIIVKLSDVTCMTIILSPFNPLHSYYDPFHVSCSTYLIKSPGCYLFIMPKATQCLYSPHPNVKFQLFHLISTTVTSSRLPLPTHHCDTAELPLPPFQCATREWHKQCHRILQPTLYSDNVSTHSGLTLYSENCSLPLSRTSREAQRLTLPQSPVTLSGLQLVSLYCYP